MPFLYLLIDPTYILVMVSVFICTAASWHSNLICKKYSWVRVSSGMTGVQTACRIIEQEGIQNIRIRGITGFLTDNFDPANKCLNLSQASYNCNSITATGAAAHECGHAIQQQKHYLPLYIRAFFLPAAAIGSRLGLPLCIAGLFLGKDSMLIQVGLGIYFAALVFDIVTLPVEFNASRRAVKVLKESGLYGKQEMRKIKKVLRACAMTYVAGTAAIGLQFSRLMLLFHRRIL